MRRALVFMVLLLAGVFVTLSVLDRGDYRLEKSFWYLKKDFTKLAHDPKSYPEQEFKTLARRHDVLLAANPDSRLASSILIQKGMVYFLMKDYETARETFRQVLQKFPDNESLNAEALYQIGKTYAAEGNSQEAVRMFRAVSDRYPLTLTGLKMPLYTVHYYQRLGQGDQMRAAFDRAVDFYQKIFEQNPETRLGFMALNYQATAYLTQEKWRPSLDVLEKLLLVFPRTHRENDPQGPLLIRTINQVAVERLQDPGRAVAVYRAFMRQYPQHSFSKGLGKLVNKLEEIRASDKETAGQ